MKGLTIRNQELSNGWVSIEVAGEIDLATVSELQKAIDEIFAERSDNLVVDLRESSFMDSTGLKALVMTHRKFDGSGRSFAIAISGGPVSRLIDLSGVNTTIRTVTSTDELLVENA
jgi:anti-sigma B factor antagonist